MQYAKDDFVCDWVVVGPSKVLSNIVRKEYPHDFIRCSHRIMIEVYLYYQICAGNSLFVAV